MRIIAGTKRGMRLFEPEGLVSRPILDRVKESLFNILFSRGLPEGAMVADLFAGVGSLGLEALSRGAAFVSFVELDGGVAATLQRNIDKIGFVGQSRVVRANAFVVGAVAEPGRARYNLVFVDPPYATTGEVGEASSLAGLMRVLSEQVTSDALIVVRTERKTTLLDRYGSFSAIDRREYGKMALTFLGKKTA
jgi:16S rRNA (guanine(966)-N(2))-methyltransferase RsmD